jgi:hypothetical protein
MTGFNSKGVEMVPCSSADGWKGYALTGRPDFLNYVRQGDVTWSELWAFYRTTPADPDAMLRLCGLFHLFLCPQFEAEGSVLDADDGAYLPLREWARFAVYTQFVLPETRLRQGLSELLAQGLLSPLYYEAVFGAYLEAEMERQEWETSALLSGVPKHQPPSNVGNGLRIRLPNLPSTYAASPQRNERLLQVAGGHYTEWNQSYLDALGEEDEDWLDEGGGG